MKHLFIPLVSATILFAACDARVSVPPAEGDKTTIINPPATKVEKNTTVVNPPAGNVEVEKKSTTTTTTSPP